MHTLSSTKSLGSCPFTLIELQSLSHLADIHPHTHELSLIHTHSLTPQSISLRVVEECRPGNSELTAFHLSHTGTHTQTDRGLSDSTITNEIKQSRAFKWEHVEAGRALQRMHSENWKKETANQKLLQEVCGLCLTSAKYICAYVGRFCNPCGDKIPKSVPWGTAKPERISLWRFISI